MGRVVRPRTTEAARLLSQSRVLPRTKSRFSIHHVGRKVVADGRSQRDLVKPRQIRGVNALEESQAPDTLELSNSKFVEGSCHQRPLLNPEGQLR
jgi:hypothetical protein